MVTRREIITSLAALIAVRLPAFALCASAGPRRSSAENHRSGGGKPDTTAVVDAQAASMKFGYAAITWGSALTQAMDDIAAVGFRGIQLRGEAVQQYGDRPAALKEALAAHQLTFVALSSGNLSIDPAREQEQLATHLRHAQFVRDCGGLFLQIIDERPKRAVRAEDYRRLGKLLTELGKRTADRGVTMVYHHHMNSLGEKPDEVAAVLDAADRKYVRVLFDTAHYQQGGGDPVAAIRKYRDWIDVLHLKDVRPAPSPAAPASYQFVELGRGRVDLPGVFAALREINFSGWGIVELDRVPDPGGSPKQSAEINKRYLVEKLRQTV
jgi:inosose dehydratase